MKKLLALFLALSVILSTVTFSAFAEDGTAGSPADQPQAAETIFTEGAVTDEPSANRSSVEENEQPYVRTIMMYDCGSNLETFGAMATYNLRQILNSEFSAGDKVKFIIMTGGSYVWQTPDEWLVDPGDPGKEISIDPRYNQIWEARGKDAEEYAGKMILLDADGPHDRPAEPQDFDDEGDLMTNPQLLKDFIDYCVENYPAEKYDLILWDHGGGPMGGFGGDENDGAGGAGSMLFFEIIDALADNAVTRDGGRFDFIDFDACLMSSVEMILAYADYTDCYIASPELEPGYGQDYKGWLDLLGMYPDVEAFEVGKKIVEDFIAFYDKPEGDGHTQEGTLTVIDMQKLMDTGFISDLYDMAGTMAMQALTPDPEVQEYLFYDEFDSPLKCIQYGGGELNYYDLGTLAVQLSFDFKELSPGDVKDDGTVVDTNAYTEILDRLTYILYERPDIIYARGTRGIHSGELRYRDMYGHNEYGRIGTSGMYLFFPVSDDRSEIESYALIMDEVIRRLPEDDLRRGFLSKYTTALIDYSLISQTGYSVSSMLEEGYERSEIDFDTFKYFTTNGAEKDPRPETDPDWDGVEYLVSDWNRYIVKFLCLREMLNGGDPDDEDTAVANARDWLEAVIRQQAEENITRDDLTLVKMQNGNYRIEMKQGQKRVVSNVRYNLDAHLPAVDDYIEGLDEMEQELLSYFPEASMTRIGHIEGELIFETADGRPVDGSSKKEYVEWYREPSGIWELPSVEETWYAIKDADGYLHAAEIETEDNELWFDTVYETEEGSRVRVILDFFDGVLTDLYFTSEDGYRVVPVSEFKGRLELIPVKLVDMYFFSFTVPVSKKPIVLTPETAGSIRAVRTDLNDLEDLRPDSADGSESGVIRSIVIRDIYGFEIEFAAEDAVPETVTYTVTEGANGMWRKGRKEGHSITVKRSTDDDSCYAHYTETLVDGKKITVTAKAGSTVVTLSADTLETLEDGEHTVTIKFDDGEAVTSLVILSGRENPETGVNDYGAVFCCLSLISLISAAAALQYRKRTYID